jgi:hypothetical protein
MVADARETQRRESVTSTRARRVRGSSPIARCGGVDLG